MPKPTLALLLVCSLFSGALLSNALIGTDDYGNSEIPFVLEEETSEKGEVETDVVFDCHSVGQYSLNFRTRITFLHTCNTLSCTDVDSLSPGFSRAPPV